MYTDPDPQFLAPRQSLEIGQECPVFRRADLATLGQVKEHRRGANLPFQGREPVGGNATIFCDAWSMRRQTYGLRLPSSLRHYQINTAW